MRTKVTLVLLFLNVALFFFIFQFERRWRTEDAWKVTRTNVLGPEATDIRALEVTGGTHILTLKKVGDTWFVKSPLDWPANPNAVNRILGDIVKAAKPVWAELEGSFTTRGGMRSVIIARYGRRRIARRH